MAFDISPYLSGGRHVVTAAAAFAGGFGLHSIYGVSTDQIKEGFDHIFNGLNEIAVGVGIVAPVAMGAWATVKGLMSSKVADVKAASPTVVAAAMAKVSPAEMVAALPDSAKLRAVEAMPDVKAIVPVTGATGAVAAAVADPSRPKVIDADPAPPSSPDKRNTP